MKSYIIHSHSLQKMNSRAVMCFFLFKKCKIVCVGLYVKVGCLQISTRFEIMNNKDPKT